MNDTRAALDAAINNYAEAIARGSGSFPAQADLDVAITAHVDAEIARWLAAAPEVEAAIGDFADGTVKSWADWHAVYGDCDPNKESAPGSVCAPADAARGGLDTIDWICTDYDQDGACVAATTLDGMYGNTSVSSPLAVSCQRGSANPPQDASCVVEGGTSVLKRRATTTCGSWGL